MTDIYLGIKFALSYFTILPIKFNNNDDLTTNTTIKAMLFTLPSIGILLAFLTAVTIYLTSNLGYLSFLIGAIIYMILYGFLHTEAILDVVDALYAKHSGKDPYEIIKEPTIGAMGLLYGVTFLILKLALLSYSFYLGLFNEIFTIIVFSRLSLIINIKLFTFHKQSSFITLMKKNLSIKFVSLTSISYALIIVIFINLQALSIGICTIFIATTILYYLKQKLNFLNGDTLGSSLEVSELLSFLIILLL